MILHCTPHVFLLVLLCAERRCHATAHQRSLGELALKRMLSLGTEKEIAEGHQLCEQDQQNDTFHFILDGGVHSCSSDC